MEIRNLAVELVFLVVLVVLWDFAGFGRYETRHEQISTISLRS